MLSPDEIAAREFVVSLRGYDRDEVHAFLNRVAEDLRAARARRDAQLQLGVLSAWRCGGVAARRRVLGREPRCPQARCRHNDHSGALTLSEPFPSGHKVPPVRLGCTCATVPVMEPTG